MRVYISADIEGVAGVVHRDHTAREGKDYEQARVLMSHETNAAVKGALEAGADEIIVNDSHGTMRNIYVELLSNKAKLISGTPKKLGMMEGIDSNFDAAVFIGYHTKSGSQGILNHTYNGRVISGIRVNDQEYGEFGLNALIAGEHDVPVAFVSGCNLLVDEAKSHIDNIVIAQVKRTINQVTSESLHPELSCELIEQGVTNALLNYNAIQPFKLNTKAFNFELQFTKTLFADIAATMPMVKKRDPLSVYYSTDNFIDGFLILRGLIMMANNYA
ncbi:M55 family metallopeptidase [Virgibacillus oceani]